MLVRMKVTPDGFKGREELLSVSWGLEASHPPLPHSGGPVRILRSIVQTLVLSMFNAWNQLFLHRPIASEFVGDDDSGGKASRLQQFTEELLRRSLVAMRLHQDIEDLTLCIDSALQVILRPFDCDHDLVQMPFIRRFGATATNLIRILLSKLFAPFADGLIGHLNAAIEHHFLDVAVAQREGVVKPDTVTNDLNRKAMVFVTDAHGLALTDADKGYHES